MRRVSSLSCVWRFAGCDSLTDVIKHIHKVYRDLTCLILGTKTRYILNSHSLLYSMLLLKNGIGRPYAISLKRPNCVRGGVTKRMRWWMNIQWMLWAVSLTIRNVRNARPCVAYVAYRKRPLNLASLYHGTWWSSGAAIYRMDLWQIALWCLLLPRDATQSAYVFLQQVICLSVCPSVTLVDCDHTSCNSSKIISRLFKHRPLCRWNGTPWNFGRNKGGVSKKWLSAYNSCNIYETWQHETNATIED